MPTPAISSRRRFSAPTGLRFVPGGNELPRLAVDHPVFRVQQRVQETPRQPELLPIDEERISAVELSSGDASRIDREAIESALASLPEPFRTVVILVDVEELSYEDAAAVLACPVGTIRSRLSRARKQLLILLRDQARSVGYLKP